MRMYCTQCMIEVLTSNFLFWMGPTRSYPHSHLPTKGVQKVKEWKIQLHFPILHQSHKSDIPLSHIIGELLMTLHWGLLIEGNAEHFRKGYLQCWSLHQNSCQNLIVDTSATSLTALPNSAGLIKVIPLSRIIWWAFSNRGLRPLDWENPEQSLKGYLPELIKTPQGVPKYDLIPITHIFLALVFFCTPTLYDPLTSLSTTLSAYYCTSTTFRHKTTIFLEEALEPFLVRTLLSTIRFLALNPHKENTVQIFGQLNRWNLNSSPTLHSRNPFEASQCNLLCQLV